MPLACRSCLPWWREFISRRAGDDWRAGVSWASSAPAFSARTPSPTPRSLSRREIAWRSSPGHRRFEGIGPALLTREEPYANRYFLRDIGADNAAEVRWHNRIRLRGGREITKWPSVDIDQLDPSTIARYPLLVPAALARRQPPPVELPARVARALVRPLAAKPRIGARALDARRQARAGRNPELQELEAVRGPSPRVGTRRSPRAAGGGRGEARAKPSPIRLAEHQAVPGAAIPRGSALPTRLSGCPAAGGGGCGSPVPSPGSSP